MSTSGSYSFDDSMMRLRSDAHLNPLLAVQYSSIRAILRDVQRLYGAHFWTLLAIYLLPVVPFTILGAVLPAEMHAAVRWSSTVLGLFAGVFAFAAISVAMSDVCSANRPSVRRSYRRIFGRRFGLVIANTILFYLAIVPAYLPFAVLSLLAPITGCLSLFIGIPILILAGLLSARYQFVPIISAIEPRPGVARAFRRSASLGSDYLVRALGTALCIGLAGLTIGGVVYSVASLFLNGPAAWVVVNLIAAPLVFPPLYIAIVLQYYDLRARKEGFRITELPEDIV